MGEHKIYVHSGHSEFVPELFRPITPMEHFCKPYGGLWASPVDSDYGWEAWCKDNNFNETIGKDKYGIKKFYFRLKDDAKLLYITSASQLNDLPQIDDPLYSVVAPFKMLDFEKLSTKFDAIEVSISSDYQLYWALYGWDVDSILVINPDCIEIVDKLEVE